VSFDQAAGYYDATRALEPETMARVVDVLVVALRQHQPVLEIGVGTGRIAGPLAEAGIDVVGIDLSDPMLRQLQAKGSAVPAARADCTRLPFPDARFGGVVACHVLHLVANWPAAADEAVRVLRPGGVLLHARGGLGARSEDVAMVFAEGAGLDRAPVGLDDWADLDRHLGPGEWLPDVTDDREISIDGLIDFFERGVMGWTWPASDDERRQGAVAARQWAAEHHERTDVPLPLGRAVCFRRYVA
jgi:SAM-dependent methyltransferase